MKETGYEKIKEIFDVKQHSGKHGKLTELEKRVIAIEKMFADIYDRDLIDGYGIHTWDLKPLMEHGSL